MNYMYLHFILILDHLVCYDASMDLLIRLWTSYSILKSILYGKCT
jgi:hypothetical protein